MNLALMIKTNSSVRARLTIHTYQVVKSSCNISATFRLLNVLNLGSSSFIRSWSTYFRKFRTNTTGCYIVLLLNIRLVRSIFPSVALFSTRCVQLDIHKISALTTKFRKCCPFCWPGLDLCFLTTAPHQIECFMFRF